MSRFTGRVAIVTGATEGIGRSVCLRLAEEGARLVLVARREGPGAELVRTLGGDGYGVFVAGDVADRSTADRAVRIALDHFGRLDVLVNNAAVDHVGPLEATPDPEVRAMFDVNFFGALHFLQAAGRAMLERGGGAIVNVTSRLAEIGVPTMTLYAASKGALLALTRGAAVEWATRGVRVNAIAPGMTATPLAEAYFEEQPHPEEFRRRIVSSIPQGRLATPDDVAAAVAFLAADESAHITGTSIAVDGGYTAA